MYNCIWLIFLKKLFDQDTFLNKKIDKILALSQKRNVLSIQTGFESDLQTFQSQVNTSRTMDFFGGTYIVTLILITKKKGSNQVIVNRIISN